MCYKLTVQLKEGVEEPEDEEVEGRPARMAGLAVVFGGRYNKSLAEMTKSS